MTKKFDEYQKLITDYLDKVGEGNEPSNLELTDEQKYIMYQNYCMGYIDGKNDAMENINNNLAEMNK